MFEDADLIYRYSRAPPWRSDRRPAAQSGGRRRHAVSGDRPVSRDDGSRPTEPPAAAVSRRACDPWDSV